METNFNVMEGIRASIGGEYSGEELIDFLQNCADNVEEDASYTRKYSTEEFAKVQDEFLKNSVKVNQLEEEKKAATAVFSSQIKTLKANIKQNMQNIIAEGEEVTGKLFQFNFDEVQMVGYYDEAGNLVKSRPFNQRERQERQKFLFGQNIRLSGGTDTDYFM